MGSKKRSAWAKEKAQFNAELDAFGSLDGLFADEGARQVRAEEGRKAEQRRRGCESKNRYATRGEAEENLAWCESQGKQGLSIYECPHCNGWHLTSHPWDE